MVACRSHQALPLGGAHRLTKGKGNLATRALVQRVYGRLEHPRERRVYRAARRTSVKRRQRLLEELFLTGQRLVDRGLHRLDSTPRRGRVQLTGWRLRDLRHRWCRLPLTQELVRDVERRHHRDAIDAGGLAGAAYLAHPLVEERDGVG